jgi:outer membrane protein assembly factor BamE
MRKNLIFSLLIATLVSSLMLSGCESLLPEPHKLDIQQGNRIKAEDLAKIQLGMTRDQVKYVLGTPMLQDGFHNNRWDYLYYIKPGKDAPRQSRVSLFFDNDRLINIDQQQYEPAAQETVKENNNRVE